MVGLLRDMEDFQTTDKESGDVHQEATATTAAEGNSQHADSADQNDTSQVESEPTCKQLKSILKKRGQYTFRKVKVDFDLIPKEIPYDEENDYTIEIQIIEKEPIKIKSWAAIFAAKKAEAAAEAAAVAEAEEALKKAEEVKRREELKKAAKLVKKVMLPEDASNDQEQSSIDGAEAATLVSAEDTINGNYVLTTSSDHGVVETVLSNESENVNLEEQELLLEALKTAIVETMHPQENDNGSDGPVNLADLSDMVVAEIDDIIDESLSQLSSVDDKLGSEESLIEENNFRNVDLIVSVPNDSFSSKEGQANLKDIPDEVLGTAAELLDDILAQTPLLLNGNVENHRLVNPEDVHLEVERILGDADSALESITVTKGDTLACQNNFTEEVMEPSLPCNTANKDQDMSTKHVTVAPELLDIAASVLDEIEKMTSLVISQVDTPV